MRILRYAALFALALSAVAGGALAKKAAAGRPTFKADDPEAIWIWSDETGWHLRGSSPKKQSHKFHGVIRAQGVSAVKGSKPAYNAGLETNDTSIRFDFTLTDGGEGIDWKTTSPCVTLELKIDDKPQPARVHVGAKAESPTAMPFDACQ